VINLSVFLSKLDDAELSQSAAAFGRRRDRLARSGSAGDEAWAEVFGYLAAEAESALLRQRTGVTI
jgi:hypothetical protein